MAQWNKNTVPKCKVKDSYWIPQGWYEVCDYFEHYSYSEITDRVTAWMKLPKPYEPRVWRWRK